jgi:hypothetical protein
MELSTPGAVVGALTIEGQWSSFGLATSYGGRTQDSGQASRDCMLMDGTASNAKDGDEMSDDAPSFPRMKRGAGMRAVLSGLSGLRLAHALRRNTADFEEHPMFVVITKRVVKFNTGSEKRFDPRTANREETTVSGPFSKRSLAERAAASALGTHTCLGALVYDAETLTYWPLPRYSNTHGIIRPGDGWGSDPMVKAIIEARKLLGIPELAGAPAESVTA